jgi:Domain of unknown function (DUF4349)
MQKYIRLIRSLRCFVLLLLVAFTGSCDSSRPEEAQETATAEAPAAADQAAASTTKAATASGTVPPESKLIRNATLRFQVKNYDQSLEAIQNSLKSYGAYLASSQDVRRDDHLETTLVIRVPAQKLDPLLDWLMGQSIYLDFKNIASEDVAPEFVDITARLKAKKKVEARFLDLLQQASSIKDILQIENELKLIREEIETIQARLNFLNNQVAYSTITLTIYEYGAGRPTGNPFGVRVINALDYGWDLFLSLLIGLLYIWPLLLLIPLLVYAARRLPRKYPPVR